MRNFVQTNGFSFDQLDVDTCCQGYSELQQVLTIARYLLEIINKKVNNIN